MQTREYSLVTLTRDGMVSIYFLHRSSPQPVVLHTPSSRAKVRFFFLTYDSDRAITLLSLLTFLAAQPPLTTQVEPTLQSELHLTTIIGTSELPSQPKALAVSPNNKRLLIVMDKHW